MIFYSDIYFEILYEIAMSLQRLQDIFALQQNLKSALLKDHLLFLFNTGLEESKLCKDFLFFFYKSIWLTFLM